MAERHLHTPSRARVVPLSIAGLTLAMLGLGTALFAHARGKTNQVALVSQPKGVTVIDARPAQYRAQRRYVGTIEPWVEARIGPQLVSAYVDSVLVRPGAIAKRGQVIATLDCRNASSSQRALAMQARAVAANQAAVAKEASRVSSLLDGGFASANEVENKQAESVSKQAQLLGLQAQMLGSSLQVSDCVLRAPFDGEIADRQLDPGAFVRPGSAIATLVDRSMVRITADVPETDFSAITPGKEVQIHVLATGDNRVGLIARTSPAADAQTRTVHFEIDLPNPDHALPVGATAELQLDFGAPREASVIPIAAASIKGNRATVFVVEGNQAHTRSVPIAGEATGRLYVDRAALLPGCLIVTEGRTSLLDGDRVNVKHESAETTEAS